VQEYDSEEVAPPQAQAPAADNSFGFKDPRGVAWCQSGDGTQRLFVNGELVSEDVLKIAKGACGSLAYWAKDLERSFGGELDCSSDGGWPAELVPPGHCDFVELPEEAGEIAGLVAAATGPNKKVRSQALALAILLATSHHKQLSNEELHGQDPGLVELNEASNHAFEVLMDSQDESCMA